MCMETETNCVAAFSVSEIRGFLDANIFRAWDDLRTRNELMRAIQEGSLPGIVVCSECELYAVILERAPDRLFYCGRDDCRAVTCLDCKIREHRGKSCERNCPGRAGLN